MIQFLHRHLFASLAVAVIVVNIGCGMNPHTPVRSSHSERTTEGREGQAQRQSRTRTREQSLERMQTALQLLQQRWNNVASDFDWLVRLELTPLGQTPTEATPFPLAYRMTRSDCEGIRLFECLESGSENLLRVAQRQPEAGEVEEVARDLRFIRVIRPQRHQEFLVIEMLHVLARHRVGRYELDDECERLLAEERPEARSFDLCGKVVATEGMVGRMLRRVLRVSPESLPLEESLVIALTPARRDRIMEVFTELMSSENMPGSRREEFIVAHGLADGDRETQLDSLWGEADSDTRYPVIGVTVERAGNRGD
jgi:hypothetical protein